MANNAYYFSHDSNAKDDPKCMLLIDQLGLEGYGIYWVLIEVLRDQPEYKYPLNLIPILARRYNTTAEKMSTVVKNYGLFNFDEENNFFSLSLNNRMNKVEKLIEQRRYAGILSGEKRRLQLVTTTAEQPLNGCSTKKGKEKKRKEIKLKENNRFIQPTLLDIKDYFSLKGINNVDLDYYASRFFNFYDSKNWMVGKNKMTNWKSAATRSLEWEDKRDKTKLKQRGTSIADVKEIMRKKTEEYNKQYGNFENQNTFAIEEGGEY